jgi:hypothetical protein
MADRSSAAEHPKLQKVLGIADIVVFVAATLAIAGVFYEGMTLKWYDIVGIFVICMDYSFMPATILHLVADRKEKTVWLHIFSLVFIIAAVVMKIASLEYPAITLVLWYFYIWFFYGYLIIKRYFVKRQGGHSL